MFAFTVHFHYALFLGFLLTSAVLANTGGVHPSPKLLNSAEKRAGSDICDGNCWAGASWELDNNTAFYYVTGTFNVPEVSGPNHSVASIFVGIDGDTCSTGVLAGVVCTVTDEGPTYQAQWLWLYDSHSAGGNFSVPVSAGDNITITINLFNGTAGFGTVQNLSQNQSSVMYLNSSHELCRQNADWTIQSGSHALANFSPVTFTDAVARGRGSNATYGLDGATILEKVVDGKQLTSVVIMESDVAWNMTITHV